MTPLWFAPAAIVIAGAPFVALALARVVAELRSARRSIARLAADLESTAHDLRSSTVGFRGSLEQLRRLSVRRRA